MAWKKAGLICSYEAAGHRTTTHMQGPVALVLEDRIRLYYSARYTNGKSYPAYLDVDIEEPKNILAWQDKQIIPYGEVGQFDEDGIMPACVIKSGKDIWMYYSGWNRRITIPYHNTTGIAYSEDGGKNFQRMFNGPILDRTPLEPYIAVTPWVTKENSTWVMWYVSGLGWYECGSALEPVYGIKHARSEDGIHWERDGKLVILQKHKDEAIARPTVLHSGNNYHMWYCYRDSIDFRDGRGSYRIGYAKSKDGVSWLRYDDSIGIEKSEDGWDNSMQCYPYVVKTEKKLYMFYNGNGFGRTGIGYAEWAGGFPQ